MTNKKIIIGVLLSIIIGIGIVYFLIEKNKETISKSGGFERKWLDVGVSVQKEKPLSTSLDDICGFSSDKIVLWNRRASSAIIMSYDLIPVDTVEINLMNNPALVGSILKFDSSQVQIYSKNSSLAISGQIENGKYIYGNSQQLPVNIFTRMVSLPSNSIVVRAFDSLRTKQYFMKIRSDYGMVEDTSKLLSDNTDLGFSTDGMMLFDDLRNEIFYIQYYQNNFFKMDTNLNLISKEFTIDTTNTNLVATRLKHYEDSSSRLQSKNPLRPVNKLGFIQREKIYIISTFLADNESQEMFIKNSVVDCYDTGTGDYIGSFYLPDYDGEKPKSIKSTNDLLIVLYPNAISLMKLNGL